jgi:hypothetical protein
VSANNTLALAFNNSTAGSLTYPAGVFAIEVNRPLAGMTMTAIQYWHALPTSRRRRRLLRLPGCPPPPRSWALLPRARRRLPGCS